MKKNIDIIVYSFQNKFLQKYIENTIASSSNKNNIKIYIIDQNNINRKDIFNDKFGKKIDYYFVKWDSIKSPIYYKEKFAQISTADYILHLGDSVLLSKDWDEKMLSVYSENIIFSGNTIPKIKINNNYYIQKHKYKDNLDFQKTYCIDRNFIFGSKESLVSMGYPSYLKYYGEEEEMAVSAYKINHSIYAVSEDLYKDESVALEDLEYVPFSLTHNYNKFIEKKADIINSFIKDLPGEYLIGDVVLKKTHFENNDVEYNYEESEIDKIGGERYLNNIREIN